MAFTNAAQCACYQVGETTGVYFLALTQSLNHAGVHQPAVAVALGGYLAGLHVSVGQKSCYCSSHGNDGDSEDDDAGS